MREFNWQTPAPEAAPIPAGSEVQVLKVGAVFTDKHGRTMGYTHNGSTKDPARMMATMLNHAWKVYVIPKVDQMEAAGEELPPTIRKISIRRAGDKMQTTFNEPSGVGKVRLRPVKKNKGEAVLLSEIIEIGPITPPIHAGKATQWIDFHFNGNQIGVAFDLRPGADDGPDEWSEEDKLWLGEVLGHRLLALTYGHLPLLLPLLRDFDIPFSIGAPMDNMVAVCDAVNEEIIDPAKVRAALAACLDATSIRDMVGQWTKHQPWTSRNAVWEDAMACYEAKAYGGVVTQLMTQVEGVMMDILVPQGKGLRPDGQAKKWADRVDELEHLIPQDLGPMRSITAFGALEFIRHSKLYEHFKWAMGAGEMNRHAALHGQEVNYGTKENAHRMFLVHDALFWTFSPPEKFMQVEGDTEGGVA